MNIAKPIFLLCILPGFVSVAKAQLDKPLPVMYGIGPVLPAYKETVLAQSDKVATVTSFPGLQTPKAAIFCRLDDRLYKTFKFPVKFRIQSPKQLPGQNNDD